MNQPTGRRLIIVRLLGVALLACSIGMIVRGLQGGALRVGTRHSPIVLSGDDLWLGYFFWTLGAALGVLLFFVHRQQTRVHGLLGKLVGTAFFVTLGLCFLKGAQVL